MSAVRDKVIHTVENIDEVVELFYQQKISEALDQFMDILAEITETVDALFVYKEENKDFSLDREKITEMLTEAMNALEEKDYVLMADVLQYDFREYLEELEEGLEE